MTEPTTRAIEIVRLTSEILHWSIRDERIGFRSDAYAIDDGRHVVAIDPLPLDEPLFEDLGKVEAICLTRGCHQRAAWRLRKRTGARVFAPRGAKGLDERPDAEFGPGEPLPCGLLPIQTPGPDGATYAFHRAAGLGALFAGDLVIHDGSALTLLPDKYCVDPARMRESVRRLAGLRYAILLSAHGPPLIASPQMAVRAAADSPGPAS